MAKYRVETDSGVFEVETEDTVAQPVEAAPQQESSQPSLAERASKAVVSAAKDLKDFVPTSIPEAKDAALRLMNPRAGKFGPSKTLEDAGNLVRSDLSKVAPKTAEFLPPLTPSSMQEQLGADVLGQAAIAPVVGPLVKMGGKAAAKMFGFGSSAIRRLGSNKIAEIGTTLAEKGVIDPLGRRAATLANTEQLLIKTGRRLGDVIDSIGPRVSPGEVAGNLEKAIMPKAKGPLYQRQLQVAQDIADTARQMGVNESGETTGRALHDLKRVLGEKAKFNSLTDTEASEIYQKAYAVVSDELEKAVGRSKGSQAALAEFADLNKTYNAAKEGLDAVERRVATAEASEGALDLPKDVVKGVTRAGVNLAGKGARGAAKLLGVGRRPLQVAAQSPLLNALRKKEEK